MRNLKYLNKIRRGTFTLKDLDESDIKKQYKQINEEERKRDISNAFDEVDDNFGIDV